jgi:hypothetical protein
MSYRNFQYGPKTPLSRYDMSSSEKPIIDEHENILSMQLQVTMDMVRQMMYR